MDNRACPSCRESGGDKTGDHLFLHRSGELWMCTRCGYKELLNIPEETEERTISQLTIEQVEQFPTVQYRDIDVDILKAAGVKTEVSTTNREVTGVFYPRYTTDGELVAYKQRVFPKNFYSVGATLKDLKLMFFGQMQVGSGKLLIVVEGEDDVLMARQMLKDSGKSYNVVGLHSATYADATARANITWLNTFETVIFACDMDAPGRKANLAMAKLMFPGKAKIANYDAKDMCDLYAAGKGGKFLESVVWHSKYYQPQGLVSAKAHKEKYLNKPTRVGLPLPHCHGAIDLMIKGVGRAELTVVTGGTGGGKSQMCDEWTAHWLKQGLRVGKLAMEHNVERALDNTLSVSIGINLKRHTLSPEDKEKAYDEAFGNDNYWLLDHSYDDADDGTILEKVNELIVMAQCDAVIIDHLNAILYEDSSSGEGNAREDKIMRELAKIASRTDTAIVLVVHPRKSASGAKSVEAGAKLTLDDLKGSSGIKQIPDVIITAVRDSQNEDPDISRQTQYHVLKNRYHSVTGPAGATTFNLETAGYEAIESEM